MAVFREAASSVPSRRGWQVSQAYTVRAAMLQVLTGVLQRPQVVWL